MNSLTLNVLLTDPLYKAWYMQVPKHIKPGFTHQWIVRVQLDDGRWAACKTLFAKYSEAFNWVVANRKKYRDLVIQSRRTEFRPPVVKVGDKRTYWPTPKGFIWCGYCRRPTIFRKFEKHHAMNVYDTQALRCSICGVRKEFIKSYPSSIISRLEI